jgi:hypothetical protein
MPRGANDYSKTHFYKIVCDDLNIKECYVGHTVNFNQRKHVHGVDCEKHPERKLYKFISANGGWDNWDMVLIETIKCNNNIEAKSRERYWIELLNASLNSNTPVFISIDGKTTDDIVSENPKEQNKLKNNFRQKEERKLLLFLQSENKQLKEKIDELTTKLNNIKP